MALALAEDEGRRRRQAGDGRVPPHNLEAEESLLGAMLLSRDAIAAAVEVVHVDDFYKPAHGHIFDAVASLYGAGEPADPVTVAEELRRAGLLEAIGGPAVLLALQSRTPATSNAGHYARIVEEHALLRRLIGVAGEIAEMGYGLPEDVAAAVDRAEAMVFDVAERRVTDSLAPIKDLLSENLDRLEALYEKGDAITGVPTGYNDLDELLSGLQPSSLVVVGARPAAGKTSFALGMAAHAALEAHRPVLFFSLEMSHMELTQRLLAAEARVDSSRMRNGRLAEADWTKISHAVGRLAEAPIYIDDNPQLTIMEIRAKARRLKARIGDLGLVVVDYLQLMSGRASAENRQVEVSEISRGLKILAREIETPVVALSQLSRGLEQRADKRPMLADLRESGCVTADTRILRADTGSEVTMGELLLSGERDIPVWSVDEELRVVPATMTHVFPSGVKEVFELRLASGRTVKASANHPFRSLDGWTALGDLGVGDRVAVPRLLPEPARATLWTQDHVVLLAHLLGAGGVPKGRSLRYASDDPECLEAVEKSAVAFGVHPVRATSHGRSHVRLPNPHAGGRARRHPILAWLDELGVSGRRGADLVLPAEVLGLDDHHLALFLRHLWAEGGHVQLRRDGGGDDASVGFSAASRRLVDGVQLLLTRLGIRSRVVTPAGGATRHTLELVGPETQLRFLDDVSVHGRLRFEARRARQVLAAALESGHGERLPKEVRDRVMPLRRLASADVHWDRVVAIVPLGEEPVFDATVPGTHCFLANGVLVHNSIEQDSDVVMFIYRDEVYNPESADRGTAEILVSKHRSGPTGMVRLAFLDHYTRFANMAKV